MSKIRLYPNVHIGKDVTLQDWTVIGLPPPQAEAGDLETVIGDGAVIRSHSVIYAGSRIGNGFQTGHRAVLGPGSDIGNKCSLGTNSVVQGFVRLEDGAKIHSRCSIGLFSILQEKAWVGPVCTLEGDAENPVLVAAGAMLGSTICVASGVRVGERSLIAAGAYIVQDVPPYHLMAGSPGRSVKDIARLSCPYELIERPYDSDPSVKAAAKARHHARSPGEYPTNTWRHALWHRLGRPESFF